MTPEGAYNFYEIYSIYKSGAIPASGEILLICLLDIKLIEQIVDRSPEALLQHIKNYEYLAYDAITKTKKWYKKYVSLLKKTEPDRYKIEYVAYLKKFEPLAYAAKLKKESKDMFD